MTTTYLCLPGHPVLEYGVRPLTTMRRLSRYVSDAQWWPPAKWFAGHWEWGDWVEDVVFDINRGSWWPVVEEPTITNGRRQA